MTVHADIQTTMLPRILSAIVLIPLTLAVVFLAPPDVYLASLGIVGSLCLYEYFGLMKKMGVRGQPWFGYAGFWMLLVGFRLTWIPTATLNVVLILAAFLAAMWRKDSMRDRVLGMMVNLLGIFYLALCLFPAFAVRFRFGEHLGLEWTITLFAVIWAGDTAALFAGKRFGRTPFAPRLSPKKTNEGAAAGLLAGIGVAVLLQQLLFTDLPLAHTMAISLLAGLFGQLGDLAESMLKRAAEAKESSNLIPGHGGVLDRIDSLLFAFPVVYVYLQQIYPA
jgi:phosphatidate cytidylyltransferase